MAISSLWHRRTNDVTYEPVRTYLKEMVDEGFGMSISTALSGYNRKWFLITHQVENIVRRELADEIT